MIQMIDKGRQVFCVILQKGTISKILNSLVIQCNKDDKYITVTGNKQVDKQYCFLKRQQARKFIIEWLKNQKSNSIQQGSNN